jgi:hypothetical protein
MSSKKVFSNLQLQENEDENDVEKSALIERIFKTL